jgi:purine-nucleoside phosphorylase
VQYAKAIGGHIVGMSTALEAIAAREAGMEVLGMSLVTNLAAGIQKTPLSHAEVIEAGREAEGRLGDLLARIVGAL